MSLWVWTAKAEHDFAEKWPNRQNVRKAGAEALFDGRTLTKEVVDSYSQRGWIMRGRERRIQKVQLKAMPEKPRKARVSHYAVSPSKLEQRKERWKQLQFGLKNGKQVSAIAQLIGVDVSTLTKFVRVHGMVMANMYGRLPRIRKSYSCLSDCWKQVME